MLEKDALQYDPDRGYLQKQGKDAIDGFRDYSRGLGDLSRKHGKGLTPRQQQLFSDAIQPLEIDAKRTGMIHKGNATKAFIVDEAKAGAESFANQALLHAGDPATANKYIAAGILEIREAAALQGVGAEALKLREAEFISGVHKNIALRIAKTDPIAADTYVKSNANRMTGAHQYELKSALETELVAAESKR
ncbi:hypothetical protein AB4144_42880, partial [Rhizobiaceae sp. 2RAB30]